MTEGKKVRYLKIDRGRYFYQRRIPLALRDCFPDEDTWRRPCGDVAYPKAVQLVVTWAEEHDRLIAQLKDPAVREAFIANERRKVAAFEKAWDAEHGGQQIFLLPPEIVGNTIKEARETQPNWLWAKANLREIEIERVGNAPTDSERAQLIAILTSWREGTRKPADLQLPPYRDFFEIMQSRQFSEFTKFVKLDAPLPEPLTKYEYADRLQDVYEAAFGANSPPPPTNTDDRDEHFFIKTKIERKISETKPDPNTISRTLEKYIEFNQIRQLTARKYRRDTARLIALFGDIPVTHLTPQHLKQLRESLAGSMQPASLHAVFTPIKSLLRHALNEGIVEINPMSAVALPKDKRPIEERKWKKFDPEELDRIDEALTHMWDNEVQGLTPDRRRAFVMVVRTLMFTGMRPIEVLRLQPGDVSERAIRITGSKTESSTRVIPMHPEINGFCAWVNGGGLKTYQSIGTDPVGAIRHNFTRLIRNSLNPKIIDEQKTLYSLRSSFVNAMRRAGADIQMQRAILGHKESGAIRHYDDGPEFEEKFEAVAMTDPRKK